MLIFSQGCTSPLKHLTTQSPGNTNLTIWPSDAALKKSWVTLDMKLWILHCSQGGQTSGVQRFYMHCRHCKSFFSPYHFHLLNFLLHHFRPLPPHHHQLGPQIDCCAPHSRYLHGHQGQMVLQYHPGE